jgi:NAD(P)-dependent dehydrogenase (short-subunit alcohol dehydrogenase family)
MTQRLSGKVAIVTGAGRGIGAACAQAMAREGAAVVVSDIDGDTAAQVAQAITASGGTATGIRADVTDEAEVKAMIDTAATQFGRLDILHNNAGAGSEGDFDVVNTPDSAWRFTFEVDLLGVVRGIRNAIPVMIRTGGGSIINTASAAPMAGNTSLIAYAAAKAAVLSVTRYVATSHGDKGIRCNAIAPGLVLSPGLRQMFPSPVLDAVERHQTVSGFVEPDDVANLAVFLASDESRYITGQTHVIDAGIGAMGAAVPAMNDALTQLAGG